MSRICFICNKGTRFGNTISHSHRKTKRTWKTNLVYVRAKINNSIKKIRVCTRCLRSNKVQKVITSKEHLAS